MIEKIARRVIEKIAIDRGTTGADNNRDFSNIVGRGIIAPAAAVGGAGFGLHHALHGGLDMFLEGSHTIADKLKMVSPEDLRTAEVTLALGPEGVSAVSEKIAPHAVELLDKLMHPRTLSKGLGLAALPLVGAGLGGYIGGKYAPKAIDSVLDRIVGPREQN